MLLAPIQARSVLHFSAEVGPNTIPGTTHISSVCNNLYCKDAPSHDCEERCSCRNQELRCDTNSLFQSCVSCWGNDRTVRGCSCPLSPGGRQEPGRNQVGPENSSSMGLAQGYNRSDAPYRPQCRAQDASSACRHCCRCSENGLQCDTDFGCMFNARLCRSEFDNGDCSCSARSPDRGHRPGSDGRRPGDDRRPGHQPSNGDEENYAQILSALALDNPPKDSKPRPTRPLSSLSAHLYCRGSESSVDYAREVCQLGCCGCDPGDSSPTCNQQPGCSEYSSKCINAVMKARCECPVGKNDEPRVTTVRIVATQAPELSESQEQKVLEVEM